MNKIILIFLTVVVLVGATLFGAVDNAQPSNDDAFVYRNTDFRPYDQNLRLKKGYKNIYYYEHPRADVFFVLWNNNVWVIPETRFKKYMDRMNFYRVVQSDMIALSAGDGYDYYDSYVRFHHYFDHYARYNWDVPKHRQTTRAYRTIHQSREQDGDYYKDKEKALKERHLARKRAETVIKRHAKYHAKYKNKEINDSKPFWIPGRKGYDAFRHVKNANTGK